MKKKAVGKTRHVVAWMNKAEYEHVLEYLFSKEPALQKHALHRISAWKGRFGQSTPVAVDSTADLVRCQVLDSTGQLEANDLVLLYGMALVRYVYHPSSALDPYKSDRI
uniref:LAS1 like ribosome biogenesis factor n=1 Tax=Sinocyclocheilus grahami TaxID=75366 RepID=A0A672NGN4_SINGR